MWFLLSLNLSHWIGSFSTVGLDSHLGFRQKGLREAKHIHSWEKSEEKRELREGHEFPGNQLRETFSWYASQGSRTVRFEGHEFWGQAGHKKRGGLHLLQSVPCTNFEAVQHRNRGPYSLYGLYLLCTVFEVNNRHKFQGSFLYSSGTVFEEYGSI